MENLQYEITHDHIIRCVAKQLGIEPGQIVIMPLTADETSAVKAIVSTDLPTANKIEKKLKRLAGGKLEDDQAE